MNHALTFNLAILALIALIGIGLNQPLALLGLLLLQQMPYGIDQPQEGPDCETCQEGEGKPAGFLADIK